MADMATIADALKESKIKFSISGTDYQIAVERFHAAEKISAPFDVSLSLISEDQIKAADVVEKPGLLTVVGHTGDRYFHGVISQFMLSGKNGRFYLYQAKLVPSIWFTMLNQDCRIFQENVRHRNREGDSQGQQHPFGSVRIQAQGKLRTAAALRSIPRDGPGFYLPAPRGGGNLLFLRALQGQAPPGIRRQHDCLQADRRGTQSQIQFRRGARRGGGVHQRARPDPQRPPRKDRPSSIQLQEALARPDCPEDRARPTTSTRSTTTPATTATRRADRRLAQIRLEEQKTFEEMAEGDSNCPRLIPGFTFDLDGHDFSELGPEIRPRHCRSHRLAVPRARREIGHRGRFQLSQRFHGDPRNGAPCARGEPSRSPSSRVFRPPRSWAPKGEEIYTDEWGRVKVQFHWDRLGKNDEKSSCWLRTAQAWGGGGWGSQFIPRVGDEVLVDFMEGDPDWPIIVGSVYNEANQPLYDLKNNKTQSGIKTRSYPEGRRLQRAALRGQVGRGARLSPGREGLEHPHQERQGAERRPRRDALGGQQPDQDRGRQPERNDRRQQGDPGRGQPHRDDRIEHEPQRRLECKRRPSGARRRSR